jgi:hypothetical protein
MGSFGGFDQGGWVFKLWDEAVGDAIGALFAGEYDLLLGRRIATYEPGGTLPAFPPFGPQPSTSSHEAARQRRMAEGS